MVMCKVGGTRSDWAAGVGGGGGVRGTGARGNPQGWARSSDQNCNTETTSGGERIAPPPSRKRYLVFGLQMPEHPVRAL